MIEVTIAMLLLSVVSLSLASLMTNSNKNLQGQGLAFSRSSLAMMLFQFATSPDAMKVSQSAGSASGNFNNPLYVCTIGVGNATCSDSIKANTWGDFELMNTSGNAIAGSSAPLSTIGTPAANAVYYDSGGARCTTPGKAPCLLQAISQFQADCGGAATCPSKNVSSIILKTTIGLIRDSSGNSIIPTGSGFYALKDISYTTTTLVPLPSSGGGITGGVPNALALFTSANSVGPSLLSDNTAASTLTISDQNVQVGGGGPPSNMSVTGSVTANGNISSAGNLSVSQNISATGKVSAGAGKFLADTAGNVWTYGTLWIDGGKLAVDSTGTLFTDGALKTKNFAAANDGSLYSGAGAGFVLGGGNLDLDTAGNLMAAGNVSSRGVILTSDRRLKKNIREIKDALNIVEKLRGVRFEWKSDGTKDVGVVAQEVEKVLPELVKTNPKTGYMAVEYPNLVGVLIEAIKEQQAQIREEERRYDDLSARIDALESAKKIASVPARSP